MGEWLWVNWLGGVQHKLGAVGGQNLVQLKFIPCHHPQPQSQPRPLILLPTTPTSMHIPHSLCAYLHRLTPLQLLLNARRPPRLAHPGSTTHNVVSNELISQVEKLLETVREGSKASLNGDIAAAVNRLILEKFGFYLEKRPSVIPEAGAYRPRSSYCCRSFNLLSTSIQT